MTSHRRHDQGAEESFRVRYRRKDAQLRRVERRDFAPSRSRARCGRTWLPSTPRRPSPPPNGADETLLPKFHSARCAERARPRAGDVGPLGGGDRLSSWPLGCASAATSSSSPTGQDRRSSRSSRTRGSASLPPPKCLEAHCDGVTGAGGAWKSRRVVIEALALLAALVAHATPSAMSGCDRFRRLVAPGCDLAGVSRVAVGHPADAATSPARSSTRHERVTGLIAGGTSRTGRTRPVDEGGPHGFGAGAAG